MSPALDRIFTMLPYAPYAVHWGLCVLRFLHNQKASSYTCDLLFVQKSCVCRNTRISKFGIY